MENFKTVELEDYFDLFQDFERKKRNTRWKQNSKFVVTLPVSLIDMMLKRGKRFETVIAKSPHTGSVIYTNGKLIISLKTIKSLFHQTINVLIKHITTMQKDPRVSDIKMIVMVGGFSECELVQDALCDKLGKSVSLIMSDEAGLDTMKGAVLYGFQPNASADFFLNRLSKMHAEDFKDLISKGYYASYENRVYLAGACNIGKSSLASILIGDDVPKKWYSTDGLVIHFGRNGIHLEDKKMIPLIKSDTNILRKLLLGNPNIEARQMESKQSIVSTNIQKRVPEQSKVDHDLSRPSEKVAKSNSAKQLTDQTAAQRELGSPKGYKRQEASQRKDSKGGAISKSTLPQIKQQTATSIQSNVLQEIRDGTYKIRVAPSDLVDFGGQRSFDMTHQLFIQHKGTFVLMFDGRYGLHSKLKEYQEGPITAKDILLHWVTSILIYCGEGDNTMPMILFAATHSDSFCADEIPNQKRQLIRELTKLFQSHNQKEHILYDRIFFINATQPDDQEIELLKDTLVEIAFQQSTWGQRMPVAWVPLELQLSEMRTKGINLITKEEIQNMNRSNSEFMLNVPHLEEFLKIQHSLGKIMYFDQPGLHNFIVVQPTAMVNILRSFITDEIFWPKNDVLRQILSTMVNTGTVKKKELFDLWSQPQFQEFLPSTEHKEYIVQVLVHLDILVEPKREDKQDSRNETYLVPCLVNSRIPDTFLKFEEQKTICLAYKLTKSIIPAALSFKLIAAAVTIWPLKVVKGRNCLYSQSSIMTVDKENELLIQIKDDRVLICLRNIFSRYNISPDIAASIQDCLVLALERVLLFYHDCFGRSTANLDVKSLYAIRVGVICQKRMCFLPLSNAKRRQTWICHREQKHETKCCLYWVFDRNTRTCGTMCKGPPKELLSLSPTDKHLVRLATQLSVNEFEEFFISLDMTRAELDEIEHCYPRTEIMCRKLMALYKWKKKNETISLQDLLDALTKIKRPHYLCQISREQTNLFNKAKSRQISPTDEVLQQLSRQLGNCYTHLGIELGISFSSIEESMYRFPKDMYDLIYDILKKWKEQENATVHILMIALQRIDCGGLRFLQEKYK
ncbi:unnamed protein product [Mytilus coruscus]|uniref:Death domain-containing protein n=1 Tax=Mytilus coruscus TaxID=42192 RepID=A0A6J8BDM1_MYTCO|nr:unnamed protein product [Mytilus coruscus]